MRIAALLLTSLIVCGSARADLIIPETSAPRILIPAAGNAPGANGTYFRSDIQIANLRNADQRVLMYWLPQGSSGAAITPLAIDLGASRGFSSDDFVTNVLHQTGIGAIEFVGVNANGQFDPNARLHVSSRIYTPRPDGSDGTMSQTFPAIILTGSTSNSKTIFGMRHSSQYRVNVGIANPSETTRRYRVTVRINTSTTDETDLFVMELPPRSILQRSTTFTRVGVVQALIEDITGGVSFEWHAWGSTIDNQSGDAWSQMAFPTPAP
jgi:hypothetical protein